MVTRASARSTKISIARSPRYALEGCDRIYREKASGKDMRNRPELAKAIDALPTKGVLVLAEWDRATRSLMDGIAIMEKVHKRDAYIKEEQKKSPNKADKAFDEAVRGALREQADKKGIKLPD